MSTINVNLMADSQGGSVAPISSVMRNRIINGAMVISQRHGTSAVTVDGAATYITDRFIVQDFSDAVLSAQQVSDAPAGFVNSLRVTVTTADASLAATQGARVNQRIEGFNIADLGWGTANAQTVTLSFWVKSSLTGTFGGSLQTETGGRAYPYTYTISAANTWEQKSITIVGDTSGTWNTTNGVGVIVQWGLGMGSTYSGTAGAWVTGDFLSATGAVSVVGTLNATFQVTGVQLEKGTQATSFEYRQIGTELALCQRYCYVARDQGGTPFVAGAADATNSVLLTYNLPVQPRATPTLSFSGNVIISDQFITDHTASPPTVTTAPINSTVNGRVRLGGFSGLTIGRFYGGAPNQTGITTFSMEL